MHFPSAPKLPLGLRLLHGATVLLLTVRLLPGTTILLLLLLLLLSGAAQ